MRHLPAQLLARRGATAAVVCNAPAVPAAPLFVAAPMVLQSELAFRLLCRRHGAGLCYTPMVHSDRFVECQPYRALILHDILDRPVEDTPLIAQLCASNTSDLVTAVRDLLHLCNAPAAPPAGDCRRTSVLAGIDLNLGCPQETAEMLGFGVFLMDKPALVEDMVRGMVAAAAPLPVSAKIRLLPTLEATLDFCQMLERAGCAFICVHGRERHVKSHCGPADWAAIAAVRRCLNIPVLANGNVHSLADARACLAATGAAGVMCATGLLKNPRLFSEERESPPPPADLCLDSGDAPHPAAAAAAAQRAVDMGREYLALCHQYPPPEMRFARMHLRELFRGHIEAMHDVKDMLLYQKAVVSIAQLDRLLDVLEHRLCPRPGQSPAPLTLREIKDMGSRAPEAAEPGDSSDDYDDANSAVGHSLFSP